MIDAQERRARVISLEGSDCVGKTTQARLLLKGLACAGKRVVVLKLPMAQVVTGRAIYSMLESGAARRHPVLFQLLQLVDKLRLQATCLSDMLASQDYVVFDRWSTSSVVYGRATGVSDRVLRLCESLLVRPDIVIVLAGPGHARDRSNDSYEGSAELQQRVRDEYAVWLGRNKHGVEVDASGPAAAVSSRIWNVLVARGIV
jgi:thymidylate kinase